MGLTDTPLRLLTVLVATLIVTVAAVATAVLWPREIAVAAPLAGIDSRTLYPTTVVERPLQPRTLESYRGLGAWVDGFDYSPAYAAGGVPPLVPAEVHTMAEAGVTTLYLQSGRLDDRSPDVLEDRWILTEFLMRARQSDIDVVAWYLPKWGDDGADLEHLLAAADFEVLGHRFDGIAVDIEWNQDGLEPVERNDRFVALSEVLRALLADQPIGAIVLPPVQTEVINPDFWPQFPWLAVADLYDVWLPMSYWSFRTDPWGDGYSYNHDSVVRLRKNLNDPDALVHSIGGIGGQLGVPPPGAEPYLAGIDQLEPFARSLVDTGSIGGSIYDWLTLDEAGRAEMAELFETGPAASLVPG